MESGIKKTRRRYQIIDDYGYHKMKNTKRNDFASVTTLLSTKPLLVLSLIHIFAVKNNNFKAENRINTKNSKL